MKSLERRFKNIAARNSGWSSYTSFAEAITGQNFSEQALRRWFNKLVDNGDYAPSEKKAILGYLQTLSKRAEDDQKSG